MKPDRDDLLVLLAFSAGALMVAANAFKGSPDVIGSVGGGLVAFSVLHVSDARKEKRRRAEQATQERIRDLNETRRLLYMGYYLQHVHNHGDRTEIVGTLVNAIVHHQRRMQQREGLALGSRLMTSGITEQVDAPWVDLINEITAELESLGAA